jgi:MFS family permease
LFVLSTMYTWMPSFLNRYYGLTPDQAGLKAAIVILLGAVGAVVWGNVADRAGRKQTASQAVRRGRRVPAHAGGDVFRVWCVAARALAVRIDRRRRLRADLHHRRRPAVVMDVVHPGLRATAAALVTLIQNLLGLAAGAFVAGVLSDALGLQNALALIPLASLGAALLFIIAARSYEADKQRLADIHLSVDDAAPQAGTGLTRRKGAP